MKQQKQQVSQEQDNLQKAILRMMNFSHVKSLLQRANRCYREKGLQAVWRAGHYRFNLMTKREDWRFRVDLPLSKELKQQRKTKFQIMPLISIIVPLYHTPPRFLKELLKSVCKQTYTNWELILVDATQPPSKKLSHLVNRCHDTRIRYHRIAKNEGISGNTNIGIAEATGEYLALLDHDDMISPNALFEVVQSINETGAELLYSDEVVLDEKLHSLKEYHFKPDFSPDNLRGCNYITHFLVFKKTLLQSAGGNLRKEFDGAQDFDFILRLSEQTKKIVHIPKVLYYWRSHAQSTAQDMQVKPQAVTAGANAIQAHLQRMGYTGHAMPIANAPGAYQIKYEIQGKPMVSILIPNKDHVEDLQRCILGLQKYAGWQNYEILIIENNSQQKETFAFYEKIAKQNEKIRFLQYEGAFNFSAINNFGAKYAKGEYLLLLNNDVEPLTDGFLTEMLSYAQRTDVGAVGAKLFYPDNTIQHAGVFIGLGGSAGHNHKGHPRESFGNLYRLVTVQNMNAVTGACLMVKKSLYEALHGLDEEHFAVAYNDVDFCLRLREQGLLNVMTPFAQAIHYESKSRGDDTHSGGEKQQRYEREKACFIARYAELLKRGDEYYNPHLTLKYENYGYR